VSLTSSLDLAVLPDRAIVRVKPRGEIDFANRDLLDAQIAELWDSGWATVVLDLSEVTFLDSSGLQVLMAHHHRAARTGSRFAIADGSPMVSRVLALTGLDRVLEHEA
jgi:anti-sigma B factor antagonist